jgi:hypothetical protein
MMGLQAERDYTTKLRPAKFDKSNKPPFLADLAIPRIPGGFAAYVRAPNDGKGVIPFSAVRLAIFF